MQRYIYLTCKEGCPAKITLKRTDQETYRVLSFLNAHEHRLKDSKKEQMREIQEFLRRNDLEINSVDAKRILKKNFALSDRRFYYLKSRLEGHNEGITGLTWELEKEGWKIAY